MVLLAQHLARHRLREPQLLEAIAHFLVVQEAQLSSKVGLLPAPHPIHDPQPPCPARPPVQCGWLLRPTAQLSCSPGSRLCLTLFSLPASHSRGWLSVALQALLALS